MKELFDKFILSLEGEYGIQIELLTILILVVAINVIVRWGLLKLHQRYKRQGNLWKDSFIVSLINPLFTFVWFIAAIQILSYAWTRLITTPLPFSSHTIIASGAIVSLAWFFLKWKKRVVRSLWERSKAGLLLVDRSKIDVVDKMLTVAIYFITTLLLLEEFGSSFNTLIAFGGVSGLAIAFASQQVISNFFGGVVIYFTKPFFVGDWIQLPGKDIEGHVEDIGWYTTRIRTFNKRPLYIPNSLLTNIIVSNPSRMTHRQFKQTIILRYSDLEKIPQVISDLKHFFFSNSSIDHLFQPQIHLGALGSSGLEIYINAYTTSVEGNNYNDLAEKILFGITSIVKKNGADFAIPSYAIEFPKGIPAQGEP